MILLRDLREEVMARSVADARTVVVPFLVVALLFLVAKKAQKTPIPKYHAMDIE